MGDQRFVDLPPFYLFLLRPPLLKAEAEEAVRYRNIELANPEVVREYVQDLMRLLEESSIVEQKAFLKSFVERIEVGDSEAKVVYTIPVLPDSSASEAVGVLPFIHNGPP